MLCLADAVQWDSSQRNFESIPPLLVDTHQGKGGDFQFQGNVEEIRPAAGVLVYFLGYVELFFLKVRHYLYWLYLLNIKYYIGKQEHIDRDYLIEGRETG